MTSPDTVLRMIEAQRAPLPRLGIITAVTGATVAVAFTDGTATGSLQYATAYVPAVGDQVLVVPTASAWVVTGKVTARPRTVPDVELARFPPTFWSLSRGVNYGTGAWSRYQGNPDPVTGMPGGWSQGRQIVAAGSTQPGDYQQDMVDDATFAYYGSLAAMVPSGSTITGVSLVVERYTTGAPQPPLASPVLYGHAYTPASPPPAAAPVFPAGFGPYRYPPIAVGETTRLQLPAALVTAWLSGALTGVAMWSDSPADAFVTRPRPPGDLVLTYTPPA
ncbi:hypothetical protein RDI86_02300 [Cellulosimicrobium sp. XJ-DQ-B-000]|uniref:hypothetical protein n=1 Tax=Cellulosimicrobium sp. XJ-DQ-B-000 TaxID=3072182 RepID=UPI002806B7D2|nr:hypothetical protein [Cellulosimicrobium sp. XJ-DQ-B-000]MDQ8040673.1 hypothetical protein [Cellulosimicrobium sp. XJ-DQ-B-000]